ncbi:MAG: ABC transporter permease [Fusobacteriaceae bacterium]
MLKFLLRRFVHMIPVIFIISIVIFGMVKTMPGDPINAYVGQGTEITAEKRQQLEKMLGLNDALPIQYLKWAKRMVTGNFGESSTYKKPVKDVVTPFIWNSFILNIGGFILAFIIAIPIGILSAIKKYSLFDNFWTIFSLIGVCIPSFFFALVLISIFAVKLDFLPMNGMITPGKDAIGIDRIVDIMKHLVLPVIAVTLGSLASLVRYIRNAMLEVIKQDYIRTARSKGLSEKVVIYKHAFRNALIPIVTLIGFYIPALFGGATILETIFVWPGIGKELYSGVMSRDYNLVMALNMFFAILTLMGNLLADIGYALVDPRVKIN